MCCIEARTGRDRGKQASRKAGRLMQNPWTCEHNIIVEDCSFYYDYGSQRSKHEEIEVRCKHCDMPVSLEDAESVEGKEGVVLIDDVLYSVWFLDGFEIKNDHTLDNAEEAIYKHYFDCKGDDDDDKR